MTSLALLGINTPGELLKKSPELSLAGQEPRQPMLLVKSGVVGLLTHLRLHLL